MKRRSALLNLAGTVAGLISLPAWADGWTAATLSPSRQFFTGSQNELLADIADTIIPATDTPGAKALNVHQLVQKIVADCMDKPAQDVFTKGLDATDELARKTFGKSFGEGDPAQRTALLTRMAQSAEPTQKDFYKMVKNLTIRGYMNSEYVMTNLTNFQYAPGHYYGCVPVTQKAVSQTK